MPVRAGIPYQPYSFLIKKVGELTVAQDANGTVRYSGTDASAVIQAALNALTPNRTWKEKVVVKGDFTVNATITVPSYTVLEVQGKLKARNGLNNYILHVANASDVDIVGGEIDGNKANQTVETACVRLRKSTRVRLLNMHIYDVYGDGIEILSSNVLVSGNVIERPYEHGIHVNGGASGDSFENIIVENNVVREESTAAGIAIGAGYGTIRKVIVRGNIVESCQYIGIGVSKFGRNPAIYDVLIEGNVVWNNALSGAFRNALHVSDFPNVVVKGNIVVENKLHGIGVENTARTLIIGNLVRGNYGHGVYLYGTTDTQVIGNDIIDNGRGGTYTYGVWVTGGAVGDRIMYNRITDTGTTKVQRGVRTYTNTYVFGNDLTGNYAPIAIGASGQVIKGNLGYVTENYGTATFSGDGTTKVFNVSSHGLAVSPTDRTRIRAYATPQSADAEAASPVSAYPADLNADGAFEGLKIVFATAPASGTNNVVVKWHAELD